METLEKAPPQPIEKAESTPSALEPRKEASFDIEGMKQQMEKDYYNPDKAVEDLKAGRSFNEPVQKRGALEERLNEKEKEPDTWWVKFKKLF